MIRTAGIFLLIIGLALYSCTSQKKGSGAPPNQQKEVRLGESSYFIDLPNDMIMSEARGKEGQLGYDFTARSQGSDFSGFIEIRHGHPIGRQDIFSSLEVKDSLYAPFLGTRTLWLIKENPAGLLATTQKGNVSAFITAKDRKDVDRLITVFSTLSEK
jgi:hypothetical protein